MKNQIFDDIIKEYNIGHINEFQYDNAMRYFIEKKYDIMSFYGSLTITPGDNIVYTRDYISDIQIDNPLYYVVNDTEFPITDKTRILSFLTPLKQVVIRNKTDKCQRITFKRWFIRLDLANQLDYILIKDGPHYYCYGEIYNNE